MREFSPQPHWAREHTASKDAKSFAMNHPNRDKEREDSPGDDLRQGQAAGICLPACCRRSIEYKEASACVFRLSEASAVISASA
jgi:hypothetical protein